MVKLLIFTFKVTKNLSLLQLFNTFLIPNSRYISFRNNMSQKEENQSLLEENDIDY